MRSFRTPRFGSPFVGGEARGPRVSRRESRLFVERAGRSDPRVRLQRVFDQPLVQSLEPGEVVGAEVAGVPEHRRHRARFARLAEHVETRLPRRLEVDARVREGLFHDRQREDDELVVEGAHDPVAVLKADLAVATPRVGHVEVQVVLSAAADRPTEGYLEVGLLFGQPLRVAVRLVGPVESHLTPAGVESVDELPNPRVGQIVASRVEHPPLHRQPLPGRPVPEQRLLREEVERRPDPEVVLDIGDPVELPVRVLRRQERREVVATRRRVVARYPVVERLIRLVRSVDVVGEQQRERRVRHARTRSAHRLPTSVTISVMYAVTSILSASSRRRRRFQRASAPPSAASASARSTASSASVVETTRPYSPSAAKFPISAARGSYRTDGVPRTPASVAMVPESPAYTSANASSWCIRAGPTGGSWPTNSAGSGRSLVTYTSPWVPSPSTSERTAAAGSPSAPASWCASIPTSRTTAYRSSGSTPASRSDVGSGSNRAGWRYASSWN